MKEEVLKKIKSLSEKPCLYMKDKAILYHYQVLLASLCLKEEGVPVNDDSISHVIGNKYWRMRQVIQENQHFIDAHLRQRD